MYSDMQDVVRAVCADFDRQAERHLLEAEAMRTRELEQAARPRSRRHVPRFHAPKLGWMTRQAN